MEGTASTYNIEEWYKVYVDAIIIRLQTTDGTIFLDSSHRHILRISTS
jgi:hypothetical protein